MSDQSLTMSSIPDPTEATADAHGYKVTYHPAFARKATVAAGGAPELELFEQTDTYHLPENTVHPTRHVIRIQNGPHGRDVTLTIDDPHHHIAHLQIGLYPPGRQPGVEPTPQPVETVTIQNGGPTCPPSCPE